MTRTLECSLWIATCLIAVPSAVVHGEEVGRDRHRQTTVLAMAADQPAADVSGPSAFERMKSCDPKMALHAVDEILHEPGNLDRPDTLFAVALSLFQNGRKDDAVFWFYAAQLRARYQAVFDKEGGGLLLSGMLMTIGTPINNYAFQDVSKFDETLDRVIEWDRTAPNRYRERVKAEDAEEQVAQLYAGLDELKAKLVSDKQELERQARASAPGIERVMSEKRAKICSGPVDPAYARQAEQKQSRAAVEWTKDNPKVQLAVGAVDSAGPYLVNRGEHEVLPHRYVMMVTGERGRVFPVVDVSRSSSGEPKFTLVCISPVSPGDLDIRQKLCQE